ncbi:hypothetical protein ACW4FQ_25925 [Escherichia coli]
MVYTVDHGDDLTTLAAMGVDGIFTNRPDRFLHPKQGDSLLQQEIPKR